MAGKPRTERVAYRVSPREKRLIDKAGALSRESSSADASEIMRSSAIVTSQNIIMIKTGEIDMLAALENYRKVLEELLSSDEALEGDEEPGEGLQ